MINKKFPTIYNICLTLFIDAIGTGLVFPIISETINNGIGLSYVQNL